MYHVKFVADTQNIELEEIILSTKLCKIPKGKQGVAYSAIPFFHLAEKAVPSNLSDKLHQITLEEWKEHVKSDYLLE